MENEVCVVIPVYKEKLDSDEVKAVRQCIRKLQKLKMFFIAPAELNVCWYKRNFPDWEILNSIYWKKPKVEYYNKMLLNSSFYKLFSRYSYIFLYQTDGYILGDTERLKEFCQKGYDYWGAPWYTPWGGQEICRWSFRGVEHIPYMSSHIVPRVCYVGNGGVSLRKTSACINLLQNKWFEAKIWYENEDKFFAYHGMDGEGKLFLLPPAEEAEKFALELEMKDRIMKGRVPFAVHAWKKHFPEMIMRLGEDIEE